MANFECLVKKYPTGELQRLIFIDNGDGTWTMTTADSNETYQSLASAIVAGSEIRTKATAPGGSTTQVQYNNGGAFDGAALARVVTQGTVNEVLQVAAGFNSAGIWASVGGIARQALTPAGNVGGGEDVLQTMTISNLMLVRPGDRVEFEFWCTFAADGTSKQVRVRVGGGLGTLVYDSTAQLQNGGALCIKGRIVFLASGSQIAMFTALNDAAIPLFLDTATFTSLSFDEGLNTAVVVTGEDAGVDNGVVCPYANMTFYPASPQ